MTGLVIKELSENRDLDHKAMSKIYGAFNPVPEPPAGYLKYLTSIRKRRLAALMKSMRNSR